MATAFPESERIPQRTASIPEPENHGNSSSRPRAEPEVSIEPMPEWSQALDIWGPAWEIHCYGLGGVFALISMVSFVSLLRLLVGRHSSGNKRKISMVLLGLLVVYGISRCLFLCVDAYHHVKRIPLALLNVLWGIAQPCMIASYSLLFVVIRNAIRLKQRFQTWFNTRNIALVVIPHFAFVFGSELTVAFLPRLRALTFVCQLFYALLSLFLSLFYFYLTMVIWKSVKSMKNVSVNSTNRNADPMSRILASCVTVAMLGLLIACMQVYAMLGPFGIYTNSTYVSAWPWYGFTTTMRLLELFMAAILFAIARHQSASSTVRPLPKRHDKGAWTLQSLGHTDTRATTS